MQNKGLICTGFHRSATSATASYLKLSGLNMGSHLMWGHISNPTGHFEDVELVNLHDAALAASGTSWQYTGEVELQVHRRALSLYAEQRFGGQKIHGQASF